MIFCKLLIASLLVISGANAGPLNFPLNGQSSIEDMVQQGYDVATGRRKLEIEGNVLDGTAEFSTSYTNEEILTMLAIGGAILLFLCCCGVVCKTCFCPKRNPPTVIMYQQMPPTQPHQGRSPIHFPGVHNIVLPTVRNNSSNGYSEMESQAPGTPPPPPYPGHHQ